jgi:hypothetical protein
MAKLNPKTTGFVVGKFFVLLDLIWIVLVGIGLGQWFCDWLHTLFFVNNPYTVGSLTFVGVIVSLVGVAVIGFVVGWLFARTNNWVSTKKWCK